MTIYLVRHARAPRGSRWTGPGERRPLTVDGRRQAWGLLERLAGRPVERILSSPALRCVQTVEPLARERGLPIERDVRLAEGEHVAKLRRLLDELAGKPCVLCSHGDLIPALLGQLEEEGVELDDGGRCQKGSTWTLDGSGSRITRGSYEPPLEREPRPRRPPEPAPGEAQKRLAVLDLGSTSFNLLVADVTARGALRRVESERVMLRLGAVIARGSGEIPNEVCDLAVETAVRLRSLADESGAARLVAVGTAALRDAPNGPALARRLGLAVGTKVRILSGAEEARAIFQALRRGLWLGPGATLGLDLGGGSLELVIGEGERVCFETTMRLGVARVHHEEVHSDPMTPAERDSVRRKVETLLDPHVRSIAELFPTSCVAAGGTVRALARLLIAREEDPPAAVFNQRFTSAGELAELAHELVRSTQKQRLAMPGIDARRADLIPTGALILETVADRLGLDGYTTSEWGLREGILFDALSES